MNEDPPEGDPTHTAAPTGLPSEAIGPSVRKGPVAPAREMRHVSS